MGVQHISAVTLAVSDMRRSINFYQRLGFEVVYGGQQATFTSLRSGEAFVNLLAGAYIESKPSQPMDLDSWWSSIQISLHRVNCHADRMARFMPNA